MKLYRGTFPSPIGLMRMLSDGTALRVLSFEDQDDWLDRHLAAHYADCEIVAGDPTGLAGTLDAYFSGELTAIDGILVAAVGSDFQRAVWALLCEIPVGTTTTYGALAKTLGKPPGASRAVGLANGSNPISIVVPCHRVIGANGTLTGYAGGLPRKQWLLAHERVELDLKPPTLDYSPGLAR
jgi:methylated-DNA-[protein]-cysteine S-methyltransferase